MKASSRRASFTWGEALKALAVMTIACVAFLYLISIALQ